jgi:hypothetical protein
LSLETLAEEIVDPTASRVLARSPLGYGHDPEAAGSGAGVVEVVPQAASNTLVVSSRTSARKLRRPVTFIVI